MSAFIPIVVESYVGYKADEAPRAFSHRGRAISSRMCLTAGTSIGRPRASFSELLQGAYH